MCFFKARCPASTLCAPINAKRKVVSLSSHMTHRILILSTSPAGLITLGWEKFEDQRVRFTPFGYNDVRLIAQDKMHAVLQGSGQVRSLLSVTAT